MSLRREAAFPPAAAAARRALELDPSLAEPHLALGQVACYYDATSWGPRSTRVRRSSRRSEPPLVPRARFWCLVGRAPEAAESVRGALTAEPYSLILQTTLAVTALFRRDFDEGIGQLRALLALDPDFAHARFYYAVALQLTGRDDEVVADTARPVPDHYEQQYLALRGSALARLGRTADARAADGALRALSSRGRFVSCFNLAWLAIGMDEFDHAIGLLEAGFAERDPWLVYLPHYPLFDPLRGNPRFQALVRRVEKGFVEPE